MIRRSIGFMCIAFLTVISNGMVEEEPNQWRNLLTYTLEVQDVKCDPYIPGRMYAVGEWPIECDTGGQISMQPVKSDDYGKTWRKIDNGLPPWESRLKLCILNFKSTKDKKTLYYVYGESIFKSENEGESWEFLYEFDWHQISAIGLDQDTQTVLIGANEFPNSYIYISKDGGRTFSTAYSNEHCCGVTKFEFSDLENNVVFATTDIYNNFLLKSDDNGENWRPMLSDFWGWGNRGVRDLAIHPTNPKVMIAVLDDPYWMPSSLKKTTDGGNTWTDFAPNTYSYNGMSAVIHPTNPDIIIQCKESQIETISRTTDGGATWSANLRGVGYLDLYYIPEIVQSPWDVNMLFLNFGGFFKSTDSGETWEAQNPLCVNSFDKGRFGFLNPGNPDHMLFVMVQVGIFRSMDGGKTWTSSNKGIKDISEFRCYNLCSDAIRPENIYIAAQDREDGSRDGKTRIFKSFDYGANWQELPETPRHHLDYIKASTKVQDRIFGIVGDEYTSWDDVFQYLIVSDDGGMSWREITLPENDRVLDILEQPGDLNYWYVLGAMNFSHNPNYIEVLFKSEDGGATWTKKFDESGFRCRDSRPIMSYDAEDGIILSDPSMPSRLYVGCDGLWTSEDYGESWQKVNNDNVAYIKTILTLDPNNSDVIYRIKRSTTRGKIWSDYNDVLRFSQLISINKNMKDVIYDTYLMRVMKIQSAPPVLNLAGFCDTNIRRNEEGKLSIAVYARDNDIHDKVTSIEIFSGDEPLYIQIASENPENSGLFHGEYAIQCGESGVFGINLRAKDVFGNLSAPWPVASSK